MAKKGFIDQGDLSPEHLELTGAGGNSGSAPNSEEEDDEKYELPAVEPATLTDEEVEAAKRGAREADQARRAAAKTGFQYAVEAGRWLNRLRADPRIGGYGRWMPTVRELGIAHSMANLYMRIASNEAFAYGKLATVANLDVELMSLKEIDAALTALHDQAVDHAERLRGAIALQAAPPISAEEFFVIVGMGDLSNDHLLASARWHLDLLRLRGLSIEDVTAEAPPPEAETTAPPSMPETTEVVSAQD